MLGTHKKLRESCFKDDLDVSEVNTQLPRLHEIIKKASPDVRSVTSIHTICDVMDSNEVFKEILPAVHKLLLLYLTIPIMSATAERAFSALQQVLTYSRSPMTEKRLTTFYYSMSKKNKTDNLDLASVAKEFIARNEECLKYFGNY